MSVRLDSLRETSRRRKKSPGETAGIMFLNMIKERALPKSDRHLLLQPPTSDHWVHNVTAAVLMGHETVRDGWITVYDNTATEFVQSLQYFLLVLNISQWKPVQTVSWFEATRNKLAGYRTVLSVTDDQTSCVLVHLNLSVPLLKNHVAWCAFTNPDQFKDCSHVQMEE